jgi:hypothetical protein
VKIWKSWKCDRISLKNSSLFHDVVASDGIIFSSEIDQFSFLDLFFRLLSAPTRSLKNKIRIQLLTYQTTFIWENLTNFRKNFKVRFSECNFAAHFKFLMAHFTKVPRQTVWWPLCQSMKNLWIVGSNSIEKNTWPISNNRFGLEKEIEGVGSNPTKNGSWFDILTNKFARNMKNSWI